MPSFIDLTGQRFGKLVVDQYLNKSMWQCSCDCGQRPTVKGQSLRDGHTKSCGCGIADSNKRRAKHGMYRTKAYKTWQGIKQRCENLKSDAYHRYGGRGIKVCDRWQEFENFLSDMGEPPVGASIDRIDNDGDYTPENCRWATVQEQQNNISTNRLFTHDGKTQTLAQWARELGIAYHVLKYRLNHGWQPPKLFSTDNLKGTTTKFLVEYDGEMVPIKDVSLTTGIPLATLYWRYANGKNLV